MKIFKISMLSLVIVSVFTMASAFSTRALPIDYTFIDEFQLGDNSDPLDDDANWVQQTLPSCDNDEFVCGAVAVPEPNQTLTEQQVREAIKATYDSQTQSLTHNQEIEVRITGVLIGKVIVKLKS